MKIFDSLFDLAQRIGEPLLRFAMGLVLLWIAGLKFVDPAPVRGRLEPSLPRFAFSGFVYILGCLGTVAPPLLVAGLWVRWRRLGLRLLFGGALTILISTPAITHAPSTR